MRKYLQLYRVGFLLLVAAFGVIGTGCGSSVRAESEEIQAAGEEETQVTEREEQQAVTKELFAMDTYMTLTGYGEEAQEALEESVQKIEELDDLLSTGKADSEISRLNAGEVVSLSEATTYLIQRGIEISKATQGVFDLTVYPIMKLWGFTDEQYRVPAQEELLQVMQKTGMGHLQYDAKAKSLELDEGTQIDLGGIAKGYTSDLVADIFEEYGVKSGIVSLGGNVQAIGDKPDGSRWKVGIQQPSDEVEGYVGCYEASDECVITSGGYERYFEENGKRYHHIIDPATGQPAESGLISVSIISKDGTLADALSTSLFVMGEEKSIAFWKERSEEFQMILVTDENEIMISEGIEDYFSSDYDYTVIRERYA